MLKAIFVIKLRRDDAKKNLLHSDGSNSVHVFNQFDKKEGNLHSQCVVNWQRFREFRSI